MADYIVQKAVAPEKVVKKNRRTIEELALTHEAQTKNDGCCAVVFLPSSGHSPFVQSRTGEEYISLDGVARDMAAFFANEVACHDGGLVIIGEAWWPGKGEFNQISGEFRRGKESDKLCLVINDCLTVAEFNAGFTDVPYWQRMARIDQKAHTFLRPPYGARFGVVSRYSPGTYGDPRNLCNQLVDAGGFDGLILRDPNAGWKRGSGTEGGIIKLKRELSYDLRVTEVNTAKGEKTGRTVYKLVVDFKGKPLGVGSGVPHKLEDVPKVGDIVEVCAMDYSSDGLLREPRYKGIRYDKIEPDA